MEIYLQSPQGASLAKENKREIHFISTASPVYAINRDTLLPGTLNVLKTWEEVDLAPGSPAWRIARTRAIAYLLVNGLFHDGNAHGLEVTQRDLGEARCWLHKKPDGTVSRFEPLRQLWHHKGLSWIPAPGEGGTFRTFIEVPTVDPEVEIRAAEQDRNNPEALRISTKTLQLLMNAPLQPGKTSTIPTTPGGVATTPQILHNTAEQTQGEPSPQGEATQEHILGRTNAPPGPVLTPAAHCTSGENSEDLAITSTRFIGRGRPVIKTEQNQAEDHTVMESSKRAHSVFSTQSKTDLHHFMKHPRGRAGSAEAGTMLERTDEASEQAQKFPSGRQDAQQTDDTDDAQLEVSEDENDDFNEMADLPWDYASLHYPRFHQQVDARSEENASNFQIFENMTDDSVGDGEDGEQVRGASLIGGAGGQYTGSNYADENLEAEEEAVARFMPQRDPHPGRNAALLFGRDLQSSHQGYGNFDDADSEATTEILDANDARMFAPSNSLYDDEDKENQPVHGAEDDEDGRLEVRIIEDMDVSEDELAVERTTT
ncbi:hypothetical protein XANCAGTX0491_009516 [Xanthoria calcicola]